MIQFNAKYNGTGIPVLISNALPDLHCNGDSQCFPLYLYDDQAQAQDSSSDDLLVDNTQTSELSLKRRDAITDEGLTHFQEAYPRQQITKEDLFYLHALECSITPSPVSGKMHVMYWLGRATWWCIMSQVGRADPMGGEEIQGL